MTRYRGRSRNASSDPTWTGTRNGATARRATGTAAGLRASGTASTTAAIRPTATSARPRRVAEEEPDVGVADERPAEGAGGEAEEREAEEREDPSARDEGENGTEGSDERGDLRDLAMLHGQGPYALFRGGTHGSPAAPSFAAVTFRGARASRPAEPASGLSRPWNRVCW